MYHIPKYNNVGLNIDYSNFEADFRHIEVDGEIEMFRFWKCKTCYEEIPLNGNINLADHKCEADEP